MCYVRRPFFDAAWPGSVPEGDNDEDEAATAKVHAEVAAKEALARSLEGGRWIPPTGLPARS